MSNFYIKNFQLEYRAKSITKSDQNKSDISEIRIGQIALQVEQKIMQFFF